MLRLTNDMSYSGMTKYLLQRKIPYICLDELLTEKCSSGVVFCPKEESCCGVKLRSELSSKTGQIYTRFGIMKNIVVWSKHCDVCFTVYWYSETIDGVFNFNNKIFLSVDFLEWLRNALFEHTAIGREVATLQRRYREDKMDVDKVRKAFFKYISMMDLDDAYKCVLCGYHPTILTFDTTRKTVFRMPLLDDIDSSSDGQVDVEKIWMDILNLPFTTGIYIDRLYQSTKKKGTYC